MLNSVAQMLEHELASTIKDTRAELFARDIQYISDGLESFDDEQQDWFVFTLMAMIQVNKKVVDFELESASDIFNIIGITPKKVDEVMSQSKTRTWYFPKS